MRLEGLRSPALCLLCGSWVFLVWRMAGMPDPGGMGRYLPLAWLLCGLMSYGCRNSRVLPVSMVLFTALALFWRVLPWGAHGAAASAVAGLMGMGAAVSEERLGAIRAVLPAAFLMILTVPFTSDEVRFAEIAADITGVSGYTFQSRPGDPAPGESHHTPVFPLLMAPGVPFGPAGMRVMGLMPVLAFAVMFRALLKKQGLPRPGLAAVLAVVLMPGFTLLGPAMTGWTAAAAVCGFAMLPRGKAGLPGTIILALFLVSLKMRYAGASAGMLLVWFLENARSRRSRWLMPCALIGVPLLMAALDIALLSGNLLWVRYGSMESLILLRINLFHRPLVLLTAALHMLLDVEAGLIPKAPWVIAALAGLPSFRRSNPGLFLRLGMPALLYSVLHLVWTADIWHGLPAPATRIFMPLVPLLAASLAGVREKGTTRLLVAVSLGVSALIASVPEARFNLALGSDILMQRLGVTGTAVSMIRPEGPAMLVWVLLTAMALFLSLRDGVTGMKVLLISGAVVLALPLHPHRLQAEDAGPETVHGALLYPGNPDPGERLFWLFSKERLLVLDDPRQYLIIPRGSRITLSAAGGGGAVLVIGEDTLSVESGLLPVPAAYSLFRKGPSLPDLPENRALTEYSVDVGGATVIRVPEGGSPVYIDWLEVLD